MKQPKRPHMREDQFQEKVVDLCTWLRLRWYHVNDSRRDVAGFPDLVIVGPQGVVFAELKSTNGKIRTAQQEWYDDLIRANAEAYIWRPEDWPQVEKTLKRIAGR